MKQQEYQHLADSIKNIYINNGRSLSRTDEAWVDTIFSITSFLDDYIDNSHDIGSQSNKNKKMQNIISFLEYGTNYDGPIGEKMLFLREHLLSFPNGIDRLKGFIQKLRILFRATIHLTHEEIPSKYFQYSLIEGKMFGQMVALGIEDQTLNHLVGKAGAMENLTDDIFDAKYDSQNHERRVSPNLSFYMYGVSFTIGQILSLHAEFGTKTTFRSLRAAFPAMWKKYVIASIRNDS